jgi:phage terminase small subunit
MTDDDDLTPSSSPGRALTPRQQRFVDEYLIEPNVRQAYLRAGYNPDSKRSSYRLMTIPAVREAIQEGQNRLAATFKVSAERVIAEYVRIAFASVNDYLAIDPDDGSVRLDLMKAPPENMAAIADFRFEQHDARTAKGTRVQRVRIKLACKLHALDSLSRHLGLFASRLPRGDGADGEAMGRDLAAELREARDRVLNWADRFPPEKDRS